MAAIIRVVVVFPFVPLMLMIGRCRSLSRIQAGGVVPAERMRARARVTVRLRRTGTVGARSRSQQRQAASAISSARSCSRQGKATIQAPGSLVRWTAMGSARRRPPGTRLVRQPRIGLGQPVQASDPEAQVPNRTRHIAGRHRPTQLDDGVGAWLALPVPGPAASDADLDLDGRLQAVEVGALEEPDLDQAHGRGSIGRRTCRRLPADAPSDRHRPTSPTRRPPPSAPRSRKVCRATSTSSPRW